jgi:sulfur carrier protein ThiS
VRGRPPTTGRLPLSAPLLAVEVELVRGTRGEVHRLELAPGTRVREAVRQLGLAPEGTAVLLDDTPVPLDLPLERPVRLTVLPTFSGG